jgi:hypothetical protein
LKSYLITGALVIRKLHWDQIIFIDRQWTRGARHLSRMGAIIINKVGEGIVTLGLNVEHGTVIG